jgi:hypothetical protein
MRTLPLPPRDTLRRLANAQLEAAALDRHSLGSGVGLLIRLGYAAVAVILALTLAFESAGSGLPSVEYDFGVGAVVRVPLAVLAVDAAAFALGWALLLTGASDLPRRVFLPLLGVLAFQLYILLSEPGRDLEPLPLAAVALVAGLIAAHAARPDARIWRAYPLAEFGAWLAALALALAAVWAVSGSVPRFARVLSDDFIWLWLLAIPFWIVLGFDVAEAAIKLVRFAVARLRRALSARALAALTLGVLLVRPVLSAAIVLGAMPVEEQDASWFALDFLASFPLLAWTAILGLRRRWTARAAATLLAVGLASPLISLGAAFAGRGLDVSDAADTALKVSGVAPPVLLFVLLTTYNVVKFGGRFVRREGPRSPRRVRALIYLGAMVLVAAFSMFMLSLQDVVPGQVRPRLDSFVDECFTVGVVFLGFPYLTYLAWRRRERLIGPEP